MMKQFILAATSIVCVLSIFNVVNAKTTKANKNNERNAVCKNWVDSSSKYKQSMQKNVSLKEDLESVCQLINDNFTKDNAGQLEMENSPGSPRSYRQMWANEVKSIKVVDYRSGDSEKKIDVDVIIEFVVRTYSIQNTEKEWILSKSVNWVDSSIFQKKDGQWQRIRHDVNMKVSTK